MIITHYLIKDVFKGIKVKETVSNELLEELETIVINDPPDYEYELGDLFDWDIRDEIWYTFSILNFDKSSDYNEEHMPYVMISWSGKDGYKNPKVEYEIQ